MNRLFRGRLAFVLSVICVAEMGIAPAVHSAAAAQRRARTGYTSQASAPPTPGRYRCPPANSIAATVANCQGVNQKHSNALWQIALGVALAVLIGIILKRTVFSSGHDKITEQTLLEDGPQLPVSYPDGSLSVQGFARDGWPVVIDFEPQPDTITELQVTIGQGKHPRTEKMVLDPDGSHGRQLVKVFIPETGKAPDPRPATYLVSSVPIASLDVDNPTAPQLAPLKIYGIGGGPRAVGSVAIEHVSFARAQPGARFTYAAKSEFERARAQVQVLKQSEGTIRVEPVFDAFQSNLSIGAQSGAWDGRVAGSGSPSHGLHRLQVTGWFTTDDRSWVAALAPDLVAQ